MTRPLSADNRHGLSAFSVEKSRRENTSVWYFRNPPFQAPSMNRKTKKPVKKNVVSRYKKKLLRRSSAFFILLYHKIKINSTNSYKIAPSAIRPRKKADGERGFFHKNH
jgi:hypothetical protein